MRTVRDRSAAAHRRSFQKNVAAHGCAVRVERVVRARRPSPASRAIGRRHRPPTRSTVSRTSSQRPSARARSSAARINADADAPPTVRTQDDDLADLGAMRGVLVDRADEQRGADDPPAVHAPRTASSGRRRRRPRAPATTRRLRPRVTPSRKLTPAPLATASTISAASSGIAARYASTSSAVTVRAGDLGMGPKVVAR